MTDSLFKRALIPENHWDCRLSEIPDTVPYKQYIVEYTENIIANVQNAKGLFIWGDFGTGKTGIAAIICKAALNKGIVPLWIPAERVPSYMCDEIYFDNDTLMKDRLFEVPLLVMDDLRLREQINLKSDWIERWIEGVIRRRMDARKTTIITSNNNPADLAKLKAVHAICSEAMTFVEVRGHKFRPPKPPSSK